MVFIIYTWSAFYIINIYLVFHPEKFFTKSIKVALKQIFVGIIMVMSWSLQLEDLSFKNVKYFICVVNFTKYHFQYCTQFLISFILFCFLWTIYLIL